MFLFRKRIFLLSVKFVANQILLFLRQNKYCALQKVTLQSPPIYDTDVIPINQTLLLIMTTIYDVARLAGVSPKTVSRVLNNDAPVKDATRQVVQQAIEQLGYIPSSAARALRSQRSGLIGLIKGTLHDCTEETDVRGLPDIFLINGAQDTAAQANKLLMVADTGDNAQRAEMLLRKFMQYRAEGIIYASEFHQQIQLPDLPIKCPIVLLNCFDANNTPSVLPDDEQGQFDLVKKIIECGHTRIAYITLPENIVATKLRLRGYQNALFQAGLPFDANLVATGYTNRKNEISDLWHALEKVLGQQNPPTVLCCGNDEMAMRVYGMLRTRGIRVPQDISVAGFDNHTQISETLFPALSTAELPYNEMGKQAVKILCDYINQPNESTQKNPIIVTGNLMWRDSVLNRKK